MIQKKRFQNRIAESRWASFFMGAIFLIVWLLAGLMTLHVEVIAPFVCMVLAAVMMGQLNSTNALIRIYSRMIMCSFLGIMAVAPFLFTNIEAAMVTLCGSIFYIFLFRCYQDKSSPGWIFYAYLALGLASVFWIQVLFFLPILWLITSTNLLAMTFKNFIASLLGIITPYWFMIAWYIYKNDIPAFINHFTDIATFEQIFDFSALNIHQGVTIAFIGVLAITGMIHFANNSTKDNIRTRLLYESFITVDAAAFVFLILQPQHFDLLYGIIAINTAPLIGHFIALTHTKWTNLCTKGIIVIAIIILLFNLLVGQSLPHGFNY